MSQNQLVFDYYTDQPRTIPEDYSKEQRIAQSLLDEYFVGISPVRRPYPDKIHLCWMLNQIISHNNDWSISKLNRWIGFVQGVLTSQGVTDINKERERNR